MPFPSCLYPRYKNDNWCTANHIKIDYYSHGNKFHMKARPNFDSDAKGNSEMAQTEFYYSTNCHYAHIW